MPLTVPPGPSARHGPMMPQCPSGCHEAPMPLTVPRGPCASNHARGEGWHPCPWLAVSTSSPRHRAAHREGRRDRQEGGEGLLAPGEGAKQSPGALSPDASSPSLGTQSCGPLTRGGLVGPVREADWVAACVQSSWALGQSSQAPGNSGPMVCGAPPSPGGSDSWGSSCRSPRPLSRVTFLDF